MPAPNLQFVLLVISVLVTLSFVGAEPIVPIGTRLIDAVSDIFGIGNRHGSCNTPCPPWNCIDDSAIIHGTCCGCASIFQTWTWNFPCPHDIQCPNPRYSPICTDYQWMLRCCCSSAFR